MKTVVYTKGQSAKVADLCGAYDKEYDVLKAKGDELMKKARAVGQELEAVQDKFWDSLTETLRAEGFVDKNFKRQDWNIALDPKDDSITIQPKSEFLADIEDDIKTKLTEILGPGAPQIADVIVTEVTSKDKEMH